MTFSDRDLNIEDGVNQFEFDEYKHILQFLKVDRLTEKAKNALENQALDIVHANGDNKETLISHLRESEIDATIIQIYGRIHGIYKIRVDGIFGPRTNDVVERIFENNMHLGESTDSTIGDINSNPDSSMDVLKEMINGELGELSSEIETKRPPAVDPETFEKYLSGDQISEPEVNEPIVTEGEGAPAVDPEEYERILSDIRSENPEQNNIQETIEIGTGLLIYIVKQGDSIWKIVKNEYNITNSREIQQKVNEIIKINYERGYLDNMSGEIDKGDNLLLPGLGQQIQNAGAGEIGIEIQKIPSSNLGKTDGEDIEIPAEESIEDETQSNDETIENINKSIIDRLDLSGVKIKNYQVKPLESLWRIVKNEYEIEDNGEIQKLVDIIIEVNYAAGYINNREGELKKNQMIYLPPLKQENEIEEGVDAQIDNNDNSEILGTEKPVDSIPDTVIEGETNDLGPIRQQSLKEDSGDIDNNGVTLLADEQDEKIEDNTPNEGSETGETKPEENEQKSEEESFEERGFIKLQEGIYYDDPNKL